MRKVASKKGYWISCYDKNGYPNGHHGHWHKISTCKKILKDWPSSKRDVKYVISPELYPFKKLDTSKRVTIIRSKSCKQSAELR